jgi:hypothetical protein
LPCYLDGVSGHGQHYGCNLVLFRHQLYKTQYVAFYAKPVSLHQSAAWMRSDKFVIIVAVNLDNFEASTAVSLDENSPMAIDNVFDWLSLAPLITENAGLAS